MGPMYKDRAMGPGGAGLRMTPAVKWLLIINCAVFLLELILGRLFGDSGVKFLFDHLALSYDGVLDAGEVWQLGTYMFLHDPTEISHILWNMLMLWMFGAQLESFWGARGFLRFYLLGGLGAALTVLLVGWVMPTHRAPTLGASGALYALLIAFGFNFPNNMIYFFGLFPIKGKHLVMIFIALGVVQSLTLSASNVSMSAHFGGMISGFLLVTGAWKPSKFWSWIRMAWLKFRYNRLKKRFRAVDNSKHDGYLN